MIIPNMPVSALFNRSGVQKSTKIRGLLIEEVSDGKFSGQFTCFMEQMYPTDQSWVLTIQGQLLTSANFPNLVSTFETAIDLTLNKLETITFPELVTFGADTTISLDGNEQLYSLYLPKLTTTGARFSIDCPNPILSIVSIPSVTSVAGSAFINFHGAALTVESVNEILISLNRGVGDNTCVVDVGGGTSATPTGAGLVAKNALIARGWGVTTN